MLTSDVRDTDRLSELIDEKKIDRTRPTLILTECLLVYLKSQDSLNILNWASTFFSKDVAFMNYEMINPDDLYGTKMVENLRNRGIELLGFRDCPTVDS